jgi:hypothetical protein
MCTCMHQHKFMCIVLMSLTLFSHTNTQTRAHEQKFILCVKRFCLHNNFLFYYFSFIVHIAICKKPIKQIYYYTHNFPLQLYLYFHCTFILNNVNNMKAPDRILLFSLYSLHTMYVLCTLSSYIILAVNHNIYVSYHHHDILFDSTHIFFRLILNKNFILHD